MNRKNLIIISVSLLALILIIIIISILPKRNSNVEIGSYVNNIVMAKSEDENKKPINATNVFSINDSEIHAIIGYNIIPKGSEITYQWINKKDGKVISEEKKPKLTRDFSGISSAVLVKTSELNWGLGEYEFVIILNKEKYASQSFSVKTDSDIFKDQVLIGIKSIQLSSAVDLQGNPTKNIGNIFSKDDPDIFASIGFQNIPINTVFSARWIYIPENRLISTYNRNIIGNGVFSFNINAIRDSWVPIKKWVPGKYKLDIYLNSDLFRSIEFEVK
uniref:Uncharacterized protein n=1 Tax=candidate division CPR3 bacterium TaxID=2268181 RepID=A0A7C4QXB4_UNCC3